MSSPTNPIFEQALQKHIDRWKLDQRLFSGTSTPEDVFKEVENLQKENENTPMRRYAARIASVINGFESYFTAVDAFVSSNPQTAALVWGGLRFVIQIVRGFSDYFEKTICALETINHNLPFYQDYAIELYKDSSHVLNVLADVYGDILTILMMVKQIFVDKKNHKRSTFRVALSVYNPFKSSIDKVLSSFHQRRTLLKDVVQHTDRRRDFELRRRNEFFELLKYADCEGKHGRSQEVIRSDSDPGRWLLDRQNFQEWLSRDTGGLFWAYGKPGAGKTVLTSVIIETIKAYYAGDVTVAFFYCEYQDPQKCDPFSLLATILHQILRKFTPPLPSTVLALIDRYISDRLARTLSTLGKLICEAAKEDSKLFVVIDALDECGQRTKLLPILKFLAQCVPLFITSRQEGDIRTSFGEYASHQVPIRPSDIDDEIQQFVRQEINDRIRTNALRVKHPELVRKIIEVLAAEADGMYLWVVLQINHICEHRSPRDIENALENLPQGLDQTFIRSLKKIHMLAPPSRARIQRVLRWVVCAKTPLTLAQLKEAVAIQEMENTWDPKRMVEDEWCLVDDCAHLLTTYDSQSDWGDIVQLIHPSVHNFLTANPASFDTMLPQYHVPLRDTHFSCAKDCVRYLRWFSHNYLSSTGRSTLESYAISNWLTHACDSGKWVQISEELFDTRILREPTHSWVTFPHATHVRFINCSFVFAEGDQYNVFLDSSDVGSSIGPPSVMGMFPKATHLNIMEGCRWNEVAGRYVTTYPSVKIGELVFSPDLLCATHVTVAGLHFSAVEGAQFNIFLSHSTLIECIGGDKRRFGPEQNITVSGVAFNTFIGSLTEVSVEPMVYDHRYFSITGNEGVSKQEPLIAPRTLMQMVGMSNVFYS